MDNYFEFFADDLSTLTGITNDKSKAIPTQVKETLEELNFVTTKLVTPNLPPGVMGLLIPRTKYCVSLGNLGRGFLEILIASVDPLSAAGLLLGGDGIRKLANCFHSLDEESGERDIYLAIQKLQCSEKLKDFGKNVDIALVKKSIARKEIIQNFDSLIEELNAKGAIKIHSDKVTIF